MKKNLILTITATVLLFTSCSKKSNTPVPPPANVVEYTFSAGSSGRYVVNYYDGVSLGTAESITGSNWSQKVTIPTGTKTANIFFTAGQGAPFLPNNTGTVTIKLNGKMVATGSKQFTSASTLAEANYTYIGE